MTVHNQFYKPWQRLNTVDPIVCLVRAHLNATVSQSRELRPSPLGRQQICSQGKIAFKSTLFDSKFSFTSLKLIWTFAGN